MADPRVTIGVPVYNGEKYLETALESLLAQDYSDFEIIVCDNASTDKTEKIARSFADADPRVRYHRNEKNVGGPGNLNLLIDLARGSLFKWAYYDDVCMPTLLSRSVQALDEAGPDAVLAYTRVLIVDEDGNPVDEHRDTDLGLDDDDPAVRMGNLLSKVVMQVHFGLVRIDVLRATGRMSAAIGGEFVNPVEMCLRGKMVAVDEQLLHLRRHSEQHGGNRDTELQWVDPSGKMRQLLPYARSTTLMLAAIRSAPLTAKQRRDCSVALVKSWTIPQWRWIARDVKHLPTDLRYNWLWAKARFHR